MKVVFISRSTLYTTPGGDTVQIQSTASHLKKLGVEVDIKLTTSDINYKNYDLIHFFNIIRPSDILFHVKKSKLPYVVSTIFVDYSHFNKKHPLFVIKLISRLIPSNAIEYLKTIVRSIKNKEKIKSTSYLWKGHKNSIRYLLENANCLLPNSENEMRRLEKQYGIHQKYCVIPNGIDISKFKQNTKLNDKREGIICVARIEGLKNQLNLIRAFKNKPYKISIIGKPAPNHHKYYNLCKKEATSNITFIDHMPQDQLLEYYKKAKVHVLPSYFETTGLSSLEAAYLGCNVVITDKGDTRDYFKDFAFYCDPDSPSSIYDMVIEAYNAPYNIEFRDYILNNFSWNIAAQKTLRAYQEILI